MGDRGCCRADDFCHLTANWVTLHIGEPSKRPEISLEHGTTPALSAGMEAFDSE